MILECPMQFLLCCSDGEVVQDDVAFRVRVILGFGKVPLGFAYKFSILVYRVIKCGIVGPGLVFEILDDLNMAHHAEKAKEWK